MFILGYYLFLFGFLSTVNASDDTAHVEIVISPSVKSYAIGELRIIWDTSNFTQEVDQVVLLRSNDIVFEYQVSTSSGSIDTGIFLGQTNFTQSFQTYCTIFSASYLKQNTTVAHSCLQNAPNWMNDIRGQIENLNLTQLFIPGTHGSASYIVSRTGFYENILQKYVYTQDVSVFEQLMMGVRYLDLRVGHYNHSFLDSSDSTWWCNHDFMPVQPLKEVLRQIRHFVNNTNEIVIVDIHNFPVGFSDIEIHKQLCEYLKSQIGNMMHEKTGTVYRTPLKEIWSSGRRIILTYNHELMSQLYGLYPPVEQLWGNRQTLHELHTYLSCLMNGCSNNRTRLWAGMAELTPSTLGVLTDWHGGLREMASLVATNLTLSYRRQPQWTHCANIVAVDFFRSTGIVSAAIRANLARQSPQP